MFGHSLNIVSYQSLQEKVVWKYTSAILSEIPRKNIKNKTRDFRAKTTRNTHSRTCHFSRILQQNSIKLFHYYFFVKYKRMSSYRDVIVRLIKSAKIEVFAPTVIKSQKETVGHKQCFTFKFNNNTVGAFSVINNASNTVNYYLDTLVLCQIFGCSLEDVISWKKKQESIEKQRVRIINEKYKEEHPDFEGKVEEANFVWFDKKSGYINAEYVADCFYEISESFRKMANQLIVKHLTTSTLEDTIEIPDEPVLKPASAKSTMELSKFKLDNKKDKKEAEEPSGPKTRVLVFDKDSKRLRITEKPIDEVDNVNIIDLKYTGSVRKNIYDDLAQIMSGCCGVDGCCLNYNIGEFHFDKSFDITTSRFNIHEAAESISNKLHEQPPEEPKPAKAKVSKSKVAKTAAKEEEPVEEKEEQPKEEFKSIVDDVLEPIEIKDEPTKVEETKSEEPIPTPSEIVEPVESSVASAPEQTQMTVSMGRTRTKTTKKSVKRVVKK